MTIWKVMDRIISVKVIDVLDRDALRCRICGGFLVKHYDITEDGVFIPTQVCINCGRRWDRMIMLNILNPPPNEPRRRPRRRWRKKNKKGG